MKNELEWRYTETNIVKRGDSAFLEMKNEWNLHDAILYF